MKTQQDFATFLLRVGLSSGFISAVASRLGLWGKLSSGWSNFLNYAAQVNSFLPRNIIPLVAIVSTSVEAVLGILLFIGYKTKHAAYSAALLTLLFAIAVSWSFGIKEPLDYSVFACSAGAF